MKVAIVHDYIKEYGGAERVLEALHGLYPDAPIYTSVYLPEFLGPHKKRFEKMNIMTSFLQLIPFKQKLISPLRLLSPLAFMSFDLSAYDVIIVSQTGAYFPNLVKKGKSGKIITYTHTPPRYLYGYKTAREWKNNVLFLIIGTIVNHFLRMVDFGASKNVDQFMANSEETKSRIEKFYRRDAVVVYPPVNIPDKNITSEKGDYYLAGGRLARAKGVDIIVDAFKKNKKKIKIFGKGFAGFEEEILGKISQNKNIELVGEVTDEEKFTLMQNAKAYVFASFDEDFGITPVESMMTGTPVIAFKSGGVKETVIEGKTGIFYDKNTPESLNDAIKKFGSTKFDKKEIENHARKFSEEKFSTKIKEIIKSA